MPMPSTMPATPASSSASSRLFCDSAMTNWVKVMPSPVSEMTPMTMPAQAQAMATERASRAPPCSASITVRQPMPARVERRSSATGRHDSAPTSAHSGAEYDIDMPPSTIRIGMNRCPRSASTAPRRGSSLRGSPIRPTRLAWKCTAENTAT